MFTHLWLSPFVNVQDNGKEHWTLKNIIITTYAIYDTAYLKYYPVYFMKEEQFL